MVSNIILFLFSYIISCYILIFLGSRLNLEKWFSKNNLRKAIGFLISFSIYMAGCVTIDRVNIIGYYNIILRGILLSTIIIPVIFGVSSSYKTKR